MNRIMYVMTMCLIIILLSGCLCSETEAPYMAAINEFKAIEIGLTPYQDAECLFLEGNVSIFSLGVVDMEDRRLLNANSLLKKNIETGAETQLIKFSKEKHITDVLLYKHGIIYVSVTKFDECWQWEIAFQAEGKEEILLSGTTIALERVPCLVKTDDKVFFLCENNNGQDSSVTKLFYLNNDLVAKEINFYELEKIFLNSITLKGSEGRFLLYFPGENGKFVIGDESGIIKEISFLNEPVDYDFFQGNIFVEYKEDESYRYSIIDEMGNIKERKIEIPLYNICTTKNKGYILGVNLTGNLILLDPETGKLITISKIGHLQNYRISSLIDNEQNSYFVTLIANEKTHFGYIGYDEISMLYKNTLEQ